jgi:hypothetical protein
VSLSLRRDDALGGPGYGISAKAAGVGGLLSRVRRGMYCGLRAWW